MKDFVYLFWREINERSEGLILGALGGYLVYIISPYLGIEFTIVATEMSIVESLSGDFFVNRSLFFLISIGMIFGYIADRYKNKLPSTISRWF